MRRLGGAAAGLAAVVLTALLSPSGAAAPPAGWTPDPRTVRGLTVLAESDADGFRLHTASGDKTFLPGVNLGSTRPLHQPGEVGSIPQSQYHDWLAEIGALGIRVLRVYTLLPPGFYTELRAYNLAHAADPIYLFQGAYLPDESYVDEGHTLYDPAVDDAFRQEVLDISDAVHGDLVRPQQPGRAGGTYDADVAPWLAGWIIGVEWDQFGVQRTDEQHADAPYTPGDYFVAQPGATATERWIAQHMDALAAAEARRGWSQPLAMANWPTTDPLDHGGYEPNPTEDMVSVDPTHVLPTDAWPGGTFASFHLYPYYPDFQRYEPDYQLVEWNGRPDPYAGYVAAMRDHVQGEMPLLVTEFGVPGSLGLAHHGPLGRDQGGHSEQEAMATDADLMRLLAGQGTGGGFVFIWEDEWFKRTWNTSGHQVAERRQLWHDPLTNEQWFGLIATDPLPIPDAAVEKAPKRGPFRYLYTWADASWVHLDVAFRGDVPGKVRIDADLLDDPAGADYRVDVRTARSADVRVRRELDPIRLDTTEQPYRPGADKPWHLYSLLTNRTYTIQGEVHPAEYDDVGHLVRGTWDTESPAYDSRATWRVDKRHRTLHLRLPWSMLGLADPSSHTALGTGRPAAMTRVPAIRLTYTTGGRSVTLPFRWPDWNHAPFEERPKAGLDVVETAFRDLAP